MAGIAERKANRLRVMNAIYSEVGDSTTDYVRLWEVRERLGLADKTMAPIVDYLEGEGLIEARRTLSGQLTPIRARITHAGVREMERSEERPQEPTEHFPSRASVTINIAGDMIGSAIQSNSAGATQLVDVGDVTVGSDTGEQIRRFLDKFDAQLSELRQEQSTGAVAEIEADVATVRAQLSSPKPKKNFIRESLASVRTVLENGVGGVVTAELLMLLGMIHI